MTASALLHPSDSAWFAMSADKGDGQCLTTVSLAVFAGVIFIAFLLGVYVGCIIGKRHSCEEARPANANAHDMKALDSGKDRSSGPREDGGKQLVVARDESENEAEDGPTMVLRGSLDLMASKWGDGNAKKSSVEINNDVLPAAASSAVVEYLSPNEMMKMLFSNSDQNNGDNNSSISETLCLDEYFGTKEEGISSPKSSAIDIVSLISPSKNNSNNDKALVVESEEVEELMSPEKFLNLLALIQKFSVNTSHPYFFNQLFGSLDPIALAAEIMALSVNTSVYTYETAPVFTLLEREVMSQIGKLVFHNQDSLNGNSKSNDSDGTNIGEEKLDEETEEFEGEGLMMPGGSLANLTAMHAARHRWKVMNGYTNESQTTPDEVSMRLMDNESEGGKSYWIREEEKKLEDLSLHDVSSVDVNQEAQHEHFASQQQPNQLYNDNESTPDLVAFVSDEAHYSFSKSARVLGLREDDLIVIPSHSDGRMDVEALTKRIEELELGLQNQHPSGATEATNSGERKRVPFFVACTAGSTVRGSFDDVAEIVKACRDYEMRRNRSNANNAPSYSRSIWVHVDGAWGGSAIFSSRQSIRASTHMNEIKHADSFTFNPHKMLGAPQQTTAFIVRHRRALRDANAANAKYLFDPRKNGAEYDLGDLSYMCGRRTDAVKLWAMWKYYGRNGLGRRVDQKVDELEMFVKELRQREGRFALACKPWPFNVNFFYFPPRIRRVLNERGLLNADKDTGIGEGGVDDNDNGYIQIPDDIAQDLADVSVKLKLRLHEAGEMMIPYQPLNNQKADCFRLVLAGKKDFGIKDIHHILDMMEKYGKDL